MREQGQKILVMKFRHIGDVLLTAPLISTLKQAHSDHRIHAVVKPGTEAMLQGHPDLERLHILPKRGPDESKAQFLLRQLRWIARLRREKFDIAINTTEGDRGIILGLLAGAKQRWGLLKNRNEKWWRKAILTRSFTQMPGMHHPRS